MKRILLLSLLLLPIVALAQYPTFSNKQKLGVQTTGDGLIFRGNLEVPNYIPSNVNNAYFYLDTVRNTLKFYKDYWIQIYPTTSDTLSLGAYLLKSDTLSMLLPYLRKSDTISLSNRINLKLNINDTTILSNRITTNTNNIITINNKLATKLDTIYTKFKNVVTIIENKDTINIGNSLTDGYAINIIGDSVNIDTVILDARYPDRDSTNELQDITFATTAGIVTISGGKVINLDTLYNSVIDSVNLLIRDSITAFTPLTEGYGINIIGDSINVDTSIIFTQSDTITLSNRINIKLNALDTASLSNRINLKLNISDTISMLIPYFRDTDTSLLNLTNRFNTKLNISDIKNMLEFYLKDTDTISLSNRINNKLSLADTASMLLPYLKLADTTSMLSPYFRDSDTTMLNLITRFNSKLNATDTVSLSNRIDLKLNKTDTINLSNRIDLKLNKSDTISLSNRIDIKLNASDTVSLSNRINTKLNSNDTINLSNRINKKLDTLYVNYQTSIDTIVNKDTINITTLEAGAGINITNNVISLDTVLLDSVVRVQNVYVKNGTGTVLNKGEAVYVTGADGTNIIVGRASNVAELSSSKTLGLTMTSIPVNGFGYVIKEGLLAGLNTNSANAGDPIWLGNTPGGLIFGLANKPYAPNHLVYLGVVTRKQQNNGEVYVTVQNGFEIKELHDVQILSPENKASLYYNSSENLWRDTTAALLVSDTASMLNSYLRKLDTITLSNRINLKVNISDTISMLLPYLRKLDTITLSNRINTKLNISDTASMLLPYLRDADTVTLSNRINLKLNISDTSAFARDNQISGTSGQVAYFNSSNSVISDAGLIYNATNKSLGINTTTTSGANLIIKNSQEPVRSTVVATQTFAADTTNWTRGAGWTFNGTQAVATAATGDLTYTPALTITSGNAYEITYTLSNYTAGTLTARFGNATAVTLPTHNVTNNIVVLLPTAATGGFRFNTSTFTGNLDNVSVVQIANPSPILFAGQDDNSTTLYNALRMPNSSTITFSNTAGIYTTGLDNIFIGRATANNNTTGSSNVFIGSNIGNRNTSGSYNVFIGSGIGAYNTTGVGNTFIGSNVGANNTTGNYNTFLGLNVGINNTTGTNNSFFGSSSGSDNTIGNSNTFFGFQSGFNNTGGSNNTFIGGTAGRSNTTGSGNTFFGSQAGENSLTGSTNVFIGAQAGRNNTSGSTNVFIGREAGLNNRAGAENVSIGTLAGRNIKGNYNVSLGYQAGDNQVIADTTTGSNNILIGFASANNIAAAAAGNVAIGNAVDLPTNNGSNQGVYQNVLFFTGASGTGTTIAAASKAGIKTNAPNRDLEVAGEVRITDLTTDAPTRLVGADADGDLGQVTLGAGLSLASSSLLADTNLLVTRFDTASMLTPYFRDADTTSLNLTSRFNTKLNLSDTLNMLIPYLRKADTTSLNLTSRFATKLNISDTSSMLLNYNTRINSKLNISDTLLMLTPYFRDVDTSTLNLTSRFAEKQNILVSGNNIKTVNSNNLLGSGNVSVGTVTNVTIANSTPMSITNSTTTPEISMPAASASVSGYLQATAFSLFESKQGPIALTTTGNNGVATFNNNSLNIPNYTLSGLGGVPTTRTITINSTTQDLTTNRTFNVGTLIGTDTVSLSNRINLKFNTADTSLLNLTSRFAAKLNLSDTASMLTNYLRSGTAASTYLTQSNAANTYLSLTGGTLSGNLYGINQSLSSNLTISDIIFNNPPSIFTSVTTGPSTSASVKFGLNVNNSGSANMFLGGTQLGGGNGTNPNIFFTDTRRAYASIQGIYTGAGITSSGHIAFNTTPNDNTTALTERMRIAQDGAITMGGTLGVTSNITANSFIKSGGTSSQFLKADGTVDGTSYLPLAGGTLSGNLNLSSGILNTWQSCYSNAPRNAGAISYGYFCNLRNSSGETYLGSRVIHNYMYSQDELTAAPSTMYYGRFNGYYAGNYNTNNANIIYDASIYYHNSNQFYYRAFSEPENKVTFSIKPSTTVDVLTGTKADLYLSGDAQIDRSLNIGTTLGVTGATTLSAPLTVNSSAVFNEGAADSDFRVESVGNAHMVFVDASTDRVGIGTNSPTKTLDVNGELKVLSAGTFGGRLNTNWMERTYSNSTATSLTVSVNTTWLKLENNSTITLTLPNAADYPGKELHIKNAGTGAVNSLSPNIEPLNSTTIGTAILASGGGKWATLVSDGTYWVIMAGN